MTTIRRPSWRYWLCLGAAIVLASSCSSARSTTNARVNVVASLFPLAEVARQVGGARVAVVDATPTGVEPSNLSVADDQLALIRDAKVLLEVGGGFQPAFEAAAASQVGRKPVVVLLPSVGGHDPRVWLDPVLVERITTMVGDALARADPAGAHAYRRGVRAFQARLGALDIDYRSSLADCARKDIITSRAAFGRLAARYGLVEHAITDPAERSPLIKLAKAKNITTIFSEPLAPIGAAEALAYQAHLRVEMLDPIDGLTRAEQARHATYVSLMTDNLAKLRSALACTSGTPT